MSARSLFLALALICVSSFAALGQTGKLELSPQLRRLHADFTATLVARAASSDVPSIQLFRATRDAVAERRFGDAVTSLEILAGRNGGRGEGGFRTWLRLGIALQASRWAGVRAGEDGESNLPRAEALAAAYGAYQLARSDVEQREALLLLAGMLARVIGNGDGEDGKYGIVGAQEARQIFAELGRLSAGEPLEAGLEILEGEDFELQGLSVPMQPGRSECAQEELAVPMLWLAGEESELGISCMEGERRFLCLDFNKRIDPSPENLSRIGIRFRSGTADVARTVADFPFELRGAQLCIGDLQLGRTYSFDIAPSFEAAASAGGGSFLKQGSLEWRMPDQIPSLGFQRGARIMRSTGERILALRSVNVPRAELRLRRIGDRQLMRDLVMQSIAGGAADDKVCDLRDIGELIADGSVTVAQRRNETVTVPIPVGAVIDQRNAWLAASTPNAADTLGFSRDGLQLDLHGDPLVRGRPDEKTGVYVLFGTLDLDHVPDEEEGETDLGCPDRSVAQWLVVTDIGLTVQAGSKSIYAVARSLESGRALEGLKVEFVSASGRVLATGTTGRSGIAAIDGRLGRGKGGNRLAAVIASRNDVDMAFVDLVSDAVDLSDRGFEGRVAPLGLDAFVAPSRGIYKPGETVEALVLVRTPEGAAPDEYPPMEAILASAGARIEGVPLAGGLTAAAAAGGFHVRLPIPETQRDGVVSIEVQVAGQTIGSADVEVRFFRPDTVRVQFDEASWSGTLSPDGRLELAGSATAHYLYGLRNSSDFETSAAAANLRTEIDVLVEPAATPFDESDGKVAACYRNFTFGRDAEAFMQRRFRIPALSSDNAGRIAVEAGWDGIAHAQTPLQARVSVGVVDAVGKAASRTRTVALKQAGRAWIGLREVPPASLRPDEPTTVEIIALDDRFEPIRDIAQLQLYRLQHSLTWQDDGTSWEFVDDHAFVSPVGTPQQVELRPAEDSVADGRNCEKPARHAVTLDAAGTYVVEVGLGGAVTRLEISRGATTDPDGKLRPDKLLVWTAPRDGKLEVTVESPHKAGWVLGQVVSAGTVVGTFDAEIGKGDGPAVLDMAGWPQGPAHVYVTSFREASDDTRERGPARAIGGTQLSVGEPAGPVSLQLRNVAGPYEQAALEGGLTLEVAADGLAAEAWVAVAAVDEGVLGLNDFATPDPHSHYFGKRRLQFDVFDTYGRIVYDQRAGGDTAIREVRSSSFKSKQIVAFHSGIVRLSDGRAQITIPRGVFPADFQGAVRLMAWAWDANTVASEERSFTIRDSVIVRLHAPDYIAPGDVALVPLTVRNIDNLDVERVSVEIRSSAPLLLSGEGSAGETCDGAADRCRRFEIPAPYAGPGEPPVESQVLVAVAAQPGRDGDASLSMALRLHGPDSSVVTAAVRQATIAVREALPHAARLANLAKPIEPGGSITIGQSMIASIGGGSFRPSTLRVTPRLSRAGLQPTPAEAADVMQTLRRLDDLAHAAQLLLLSAQNRSELPAQAQEMLAALMSRIVSLQDDDGGFLSDAEPVEQRRIGEDASSVEPKLAGIADTAFALDLLMRAKRSGASVDERRINLAAGFLLSAINGSSPEAERCSHDGFYALALLSGMGRLPIRTLDAFEQACGARMDDDPARRILMASAYHAFGRVEDAEAMLADVEGVSLAALGDHGNTAAVFRSLALLLENAPGGTDLRDLVGNAAMVRASFPADRATLGWLARANAALMEQLAGGAETPFDASTIDCGASAGMPVPFFDGADLPRLDWDELGSEAITCTNRGSAPLHATFLLEGTPAEPGIAQSSGLVADLSIERARRDEAGALVLRQYEPAYIIVGISPSGTIESSERLLAEQILPAGFEVVETSFRAGWKDFIGDRIDEARLSAVDYAEAMADRWIGLPVPRAGPYLLAFSVRPTLQGRFNLPPLAVRDLANPRRTAWTPPLSVVVMPGD